MVRKVFSNEGPLGSEMIDYTLLEFSHHTSRNASRVLDCNMIELLHLHLEDPTKCKDGILEVVQHII
jgi:hypothetical protein